MIRYILPALALAIAGGAGIAATGEEQPELDKALAGMVPGTARNCVDHVRVTEVDTFKNTILYRNGRNQLWRNTPVGVCEGLERGDTVIVRSTTSGQYCKGDFVQTRPRSGGAISSNCSLGEFIPYKRPAKQ